jgi:hypothetical protein
LITRIYRELKTLNFPKINDSVKKWTNELNRALSNEEVQMEKKKKRKKHTKKSSTSLTIKEMQIKTMLRFHLTSVRNATIKNTNNNNCWQSCVGKGNLIHC